MVTLDDVTAAAARIAGLVHRTPVLTSSTLDREVGASVHFKCENLQKVGAFKARGASNAVMALGDDDARRGVITHSSGNHAAALAYAARARGIPCVVVMPDSAPAVKVAAVRGYGAEIVFCPAAERDDVCAREQQARDATFVHPFENPFVIAGQGTAALELFEDVPDLDVVMTPVGGGGLCAGTTVVARARAGAAGPAGGVVAPQPGGRGDAGQAVRVIAAEPVAVDDAARSMATGVRQPRVDGAKSWADGLMTALGEPNFALMRRHGVRVVTVDEPAILAAARFFLERMKIVVEPSAATVLAAMRAVAGELEGLRIGAILSGGNTDFRWLSDAGTDSDENS